MVGVSQPTSASSWGVSHTELPTNCARAVVKLRPTRFTPFIPRLIKASLGCRGRTYLWNNTSILKSKETNKAKRLWSTCLVCPWKVWRSWGCFEQLPTLWGSCSRACGGSCRSICPGQCGRCPRRRWWCARRKRQESRTWKTCTIERKLYANCYHDLQAV